MGLKEILLKRGTDYPTQGRRTPVERLADFVGLNRVFLRRGHVEIDSRKDVITSPCQSKLELWAKIGDDGWIDDKPVLGKPRKFRLTNILKNQPLAEEFVGGEYAKLYLAPYDLHFLLFPCAARVEEHFYSPGWAVPLLFMRSGDVLNERLCVVLQTVWGFRLAVVLIGSWMVNGIHHFCEPGQEYPKGADLGHFKIGSTVVLVFPRGQVKALARQGDKLAIGQALAQRIEQPNQAGGGKQGRLG